MKTFETLQCQARVMLAIYYNTARVTDPEIRVLFALARMADEGLQEEVTASFRALAREAGMSIPTAAKAAQSLVKDGIIVRLPPDDPVGTCRWKLPIDFTARRARLRTETRAKLHA